MYKYSTYIQILRIHFDLSKKRQRSQFLQEGKNVNYEVR